MRKVLGDVRGRRPAGPRRPGRASATRLLDALLPEQAEDDAALLVARTRALAADRIACWDLPAEPAVVAEARARPSASSPPGAWRSSPSSPSCWSASWSPTPSGTPAAHPAPADPGRRAVLRGLRRQQHRPAPAPGRPLRRGRPRAAAGRPAGRALGHPAHQDRQDHLGRAAAPAPSAVKASSLTKAGQGRNQRCPRRPAQGWTVSVVPGGAGEPGAVRHSRAPTLVSANSLPGRQSWKLLPVQRRHADRPRPGRVAGAECWRMLLACWRCWRSGRARCWSAAAGRTASTPRWASPPAAGQPGPGAGPVGHVLRAQPGHRAGQRALAQDADRARRGRQVALVVAGQVRRPRAQVRPVPGHHPVSGLAVAPALVGAGVTDPGPALAAHLPGAPEDESPPAGLAGCWPGPSAERSAAGRLARRPRSG